MQFFLVLYFSYNFEGRILCVNDFKKINLDLISEHVHGTMPLILSILLISYIPVIMPVFNTFVCKIFSSEGQHWNIILEYNSKFGGGLDFVNNVGSKGIQIGAYTQIECRNES